MSTTAPREQSSPDAKPLPQVPVHESHEKAPVSRLDDAPGGERTSAPSPGLPPRKELAVFLLGFLCIAAAGLSVYWPAIHSGLLSDDWGLSVPDQSVWVSWKGHWFGGGHGNFYRPLSRMALYMQGRAFGYEGLAQHLVSFFLFAASAGMAGWMIRRARGVFAGLFVAGTILFNPLATDAVSWISSQTDLLCGFFLMACALATLRPLDQLRRRDVLLSLIFAILAYLAKDSAASLGPLFGLCLVIYGFHYGWRRLLNARRFCLLIAAQMILWFAYLYWRKIALGAIVPHDEDYKPEFGMFWHWGLIALNIVKHYFKLAVDWFPSNDNFMNYGPSMLWLACFTLFWIAVLAWRREAIALGLFLAGLITIIPMLTMNSPHFYLDLSGSRRFLYNSLFALTAFMGCVIFPSPDKKEGSWRPGLGFAGLAILLWAGMSSRAVEQNLEWKRAGALRDKIRAEIEELKSQNPGKAMLVNFALPDHVGAAYVFRNGFREFIEVYWKGGVQTIKQEKLNVGSLDIQAAYFKVLYESENAPCISPLREIEHVKENLKRKAAKPPIPLPLFFDFANGRIPRYKTRGSQDLDIQGIKDGGLVLTIKGRDPSLVIEWPREADPLAYRQARIKFEFMDAPPISPGAPARNDVFEFMWGAPGYSTQNLPVVQQKAAIQPGVQEIVFPIQNEFRWLENQTMQYVRFDLGSLYRGTVKIHGMGME